MSAKVSEVAYLEGPRPAVGYYVVYSLVSVEFECGEEVPGHVQVVVASGPPVSVVLELFKETLQGESHVSQVAPVGGSPGGDIVHVHDKVKLGVSRATD